MKIRKIVQIDKLIIGATLAFLGVSCGNVYSAIDAGALPTGGVVVGGTGTEFTTVGNNMTVNIAGSGDRVIINYDTFNIGSDASVTFQQAATNSVVLNRVPGATVASEIMGALSANGNVYIVNPAGVIFGANATINVGNLIAAAGNITDENFLAGTDKFSLSGTLENQANISAGNIALLGKIVKNSGTITSSGKTIVMASGDEVTLTDAGTGISVNVTNTVAETTNAGVENSGTLDAGDTGSVIIGAGDLYSLAIVNNGIIRGGKVDLNAGASSGNGKIEGSASSSIEANDLNISGGNVTQTGAVVADTATVSGTDVALDNANNELGSVNVTASNDATITDKDAVVVSGSANNLTVTAGDVEFGAITATTLSATASGGNVTQTGAVEADTATLSATDVVLNNANNDFNTANVDATNDVKLTDADDINFNTVKGNVEITAKSVVFNQDVDTNSLTVNAEKLVLQNVTTQKDQVYNVNKNPDPTDLSKESAPITIKGTKLESVEGKINLGSDVVGGNPENPSIYAENALAITAKNFEMGKAQKMLVNGNVDITATDSATLSDIFTHATLKVSAENINIKWRDITTYTDQTTGKTYNDNGVGFIADTFDFAPNAKISKVGSGSGEFASFEFANDNDTIKVLNGTSFAQPLDSNRNSDGKLVASNFVDGNTFVYGIVPTGVPPTDVAKFLAGASPNVEALDIPEESVSAAMRENLVKIGIYARANTEIEKVDSFNGMVQYFEIVTSENPQPSDYKVAEGRIDSTRAEIVLNMSNEIFWQKDGENIKSNVADIRNDITKAYEKYVNNVGKSSATAEGFARFIEEDEDKYAKKALQRIKSFRQLFKEIERLGLTPVELDISKNVLLRPIRVRGLNSATLKKVIEHEVSVELTEKTTENQQTTASL